MKFKCNTVHVFCSDKAYYFLKKGIEDQPWFQFIKATYRTDSSTKMARKLMIVLLIKDKDGALIKLYGLLITSMDLKITHAVHMLADLEIALIF